jgi:hypothetical protein
MIRLLLNCVARIGLVALATLSVCNAYGATAHRFKKILIVVLENTDFSQAKKQPFLAALAHKGALLTEYYAQTHPSQPNYIALVAGSAFGVDDLGLHADGNVTLDVRHLGDLLEAKQLGWKVYAEGYPGNSDKCFLGVSKGVYARKHVPFLSFKNVQKDSARCGRIVNASQFDSDVRSGLPAFSLYIPDLKHDGHDIGTGVAFADRWLKTRFGKLLADPGFTQDLLFVVTFDEGRGKTPHKPSHVLTLLVGTGVAPGSTSATVYSHYSLLRLVENNFKLGSLGQNDTSAPAIDGIWH